MDYDKLSAYFGWLYGKDHRNSNRFRLAYDAVITVAVIVLYAIKFKLAFRPQDIAMMAIMVAVWLIFLIWGLFVSRDTSVLYDFLLSATSTLKSGVALLLFYSPQAFHWTLVVSMVGALFFPVNEFIRRGIILKGLQKRTIQEAKLDLLDYEAKTLIITVLAGTLATGIVITGRIQRITGFLSPAFSIIWVLFELSVAPVLSVGLDLILYIKYRALSSAEKDGI